MIGRTALLAMASAGWAQALIAMPAAAQTAVGQPVAGSNGAAPTGAERAPDKFFIQAFDIAGVTALPAGDVERIVYPFAGPERSNEDVEAARKALQDAYAARGFSAVVVEVPVQSRDTFAQGIVQIAVSEVPVGIVKVSDSRYHSLAIAKQALPSLVEGKPVNVKALQADITTANRFPDRTINPVFKPGRAPGTLDVDLQVDDRRPIHASLQLDNDASPATSALRSTASVRYTNLFQKGQTANITYITAPLNWREVQVVAGSYSIPLLQSPWSINISGYYSNSNVAAGGGSSVLGAGYQVGVRAQYVIAGESSQQTFSFGPDFKDFKQKIAVGNALASSAPIRYIPFELAYALSGASEHSNFAVSLSTTVGLRTIKGSVCVDNAGTCLPSDPFRNREANSNENFLRTDLSLDYSYALANDTIAAMRVTGQLADSHLITNEQFSGGGLRSVRGYYSSEAVGDNGIAASLELRSPSFAPHFGPWLTEGRFYVFADSAFLRVLQPLPSVTSSYSLIGVGGGLSVRLFKRFSSQLLGAVALHDGAKTNKGDARLNFSVKGEF